jgi:hypothetical protein
MLTRGTFQRALGRMRVLRPFGRQAVEASMTL